ncbi:MAG: VOC family protein, partial [Candidatus Thorarchaeota archaeon]
MPKLAAITIYVDDLEQARDFYCEKLGYDIAYTFENGIALKSEGVFIVLEKTASRSMSKYQETAQIVLGLETENLDKTREVLGELGVLFVHQEPLPFPRGRFISIFDPSGNVIEIL